MIDLEDAKNIVSEFVGCEPELSESHGYGWRITINDILYQFTIYDIVERPVVFFSFRADSKNFQLWEINGDLVAAKLTSIMNAPDRRVFKINFDENGGTPFCLEWTGDSIILTVGVKVDLHN